MPYVLDSNSGKYYEETAIAEVPAVDPNSFDEQIASLQSQTTSLQAQIDDITNNQIPAVQAKKAEYETFVAANPAPTQTPPTE